ncbi:N6-adenine methyltransferase [Aureococcus anophagefferens]|nr:N6-adenine methyltransferase [Aureococcus anophagefferens]
MGMCRGRRDTVVGLALLLLRASAKGLFDEITPAKPRVRSELVLAPPPPPPPALAVAAPLRPIPPSPWPGRGAVVMERGRPAHAKACCLSALLFGALRFAAAAPAESVERLRRFLFPSGAAGGLAWIRGLVVVVAAVLYAAEAARSSTLRYVSGARTPPRVPAAPTPRPSSRLSFKGWDEDERILGIRRPLGAPGALWSPAGFWAAAGLGLTVPYRLAFERKCAVASLDVAKRVRSAPHVAREADPVI